MPSNHIRIDNLPMNRQVGGQAITDAGKSSPFSGGAQLPAVYEKRDVDPNAMFFKRRHGSVRSDTVAPNLLGVTVDVNEGRVEIDEDFTPDLTSNKWAGLCTIRITAGATQDAVYPIFKMQGMQAQIEYDAEGNEYSLTWREVSTGALRQTLTLGTAGDYRIAMSRLAGSTRLAKWNLDNTGYVHNILANNYWTTASSPVLLGAKVGPTTSTLDHVVITNFQFYDQTEFTQSDYQTFAADLTPDTSGTTVGEALPSVETNLYDTETDWTVGTGSVGLGSSGWQSVSAAAESVREEDTNPHGDTKVIWKAVNLDSLSNNYDGGFLSPAAPVDPTKTYRASFWFKYPSNAAPYGSIRWDMFTARPSVGGGTLSLLHNESLSSFTAGEWYLSVVVIHPYNYAGADTGVSGIYAQDGTLVYSTTPDVTWASASDLSWRAYYSFFYDFSDNGEEVWFWEPRIEAVDGSEPPISELLNPPSATPTLDYKLLWHENFIDGGDLFTYTNSDAEDIESYLVPTNPTVVDNEITFGGKGIAEIPFYLDFDEYYWTPVNASARYEWMFQIELKLPNKPLEETTVFEFQDIARLDIVRVGANYYFNATYANGGTEQNNKILTPGGHYYVFVGRDQTTYKTGVQIVGGAIQTDESAALLPAVFNYDQTLGFIIGDRVDLESSAPFGGRIIRFALHNNSQYAFSGKGDAVLYYDSSSIYGDQVIDRGNRSLNGYLGTRLASAPPYYMQGGFPGGSYVAATGGYVMAASTPKVGYSGELRKSIKKDAVVQRRGNKSFLTSNGVSYVIDDFDQTFRPLGIPRPGTKVTCLPQGVGPIDGFVRYAYRYVTKDGTVGPAFDLDPVDARGGVNAFLGAESFGLPGETPFGLSYGQCEGFDEVASRGLTAQNTVEHFLFKDTDGGSNHNLLAVDTEGKGLTLETCFRLSEGDQFTESIFSQGVQYQANPLGAGIRYFSLNTPETFPFIGQTQQECCFQFAFRFYEPTNAPGSPSADFKNQVLFNVGKLNQHFETGSGNHYYLHALTVSIQNPADSRNTHSIMVTRDLNSGSNHRDDDYVHTSVDYNFIEGHDYCIFVRRAGQFVGKPEGTALVLNILDYTREQSNGDGWAQWPTFPGETEVIVPNFWPPSYSSVASGTQVSWGTGRKEGPRSWAHTRVRNTPAGSVIFGTCRAFYAKCIMYHGRMWRRDFPFTLLVNKSLDRYACDSGTLTDGLEVDTAFCRDSSKFQNDNGWDRHNEIPCKFHSNTCSAVDVNTVLTENTTSTPVLAYGWNMQHIQNPAPTGDEWVTAGLNRVPLWIQVSDRNEGSLSIGTGRYPLVEIARKKWYAGAEIRLFSDFAGTLDLEEFTWVTLWFHHYDRPNSSELDVYLERVFIDGNTGDWGAVFFGDDASPLSKNNDATGGLLGPSNIYQYGLFTVGFPPEDCKYTVDIAEVRMWKGEHYSAEGGGDGPNAFGPYLSSRVAPNDWSKMIYYARFIKPDLDDEDNPTSMDQFGNLAYPDEATGFKQASADGIKVLRGATVLDAIDAEDSTTTQYFVPFPEPPESSIRGIQIFRTQVVPVVEDFGSGSSNPNAVSDAWRACRDAPLYFLTEIPRGNTSYIDTATDAALGSQLEATTGLVPRNPGGVFEWKGYLGIYDTTQPRVYFAESPTSWESFPLENLYDLPVREDGPIRAAIELASRDARNSRVLLLGKSYGVFLDGSPLQPVANTMGGGVGAWSQRCLVVEKGIAYAYNGTLWAISGDGQAEDIGLPVLDLLPSPEYARLSVSSTLGSLFVINEQTGLALRFHFARRQWYVEDRNALSCTDVDGVDQWVHVSGYPSSGATGIYQDDVVADTPASKVSVTTWSNASNTFTLASVTGVAVGMRVTLVNDRQTGSLRLNPAIRQTVTVASIAGNVVTTEEDLDIPTTWTDVHGDTYSVRLHAYIGIGYWGTMIDTGPFKLRGDLKYVDVGVDAGDDWWGAVQGSDYPSDPADRTGFVDAESAPTSIVDEGGSGVSTRLGVNNNQRYERVLFWSPVGQAVGLTELELSYTTDPGEDR